MAQTNNLAQSSHRLKASPMTGISCVPSDPEEFGKFMERHFGFEASPGSESEVTVTIGGEVPTAVDGNEDRIHFLKNSNGCIYAMAHFCQGEWKPYILFPSVGETRHYIDGTAPPGWTKANGSNGTENLAVCAPDFYNPCGDNRLLAHQFTG